MQDNHAETFALFVLLLCSNFLIASPTPLDEGTANGLSMMVFVTGAILIGRMSIFQKALIAVRNKAKPPTATEGALPSPSSVSKDLSLAPANGKAANSDTLEVIELTTAPLAAPSPLPQSQSTSAAVAVVPIAVDQPSAVTTS